MHTNISQDNRPNSIFDAPVFLNINGNRIATYTSGNGGGPPLVFIHPAPGWSYMYARLMERLSERFTCIAFDLPRFGRSPDPDDTEWGLDQYADVVARVLDRRSLSNVTLMVHDSGGVIGMAALHRIQERVTRLIATDTFAWPLRSDFPRIRTMLRLVTSRWLSGVLARSNAIPRAAIATAGGVGTDAHIRRTFLSAFNTPERRMRVLGIFRMLLDDNGIVQTAERNVQELLPDREVLVLFGEDDPARHAGFEARWRKMLPHATFGHLPGEKHFPHFGSFDAIAEHVLAWSEPAVASG